jgi:hypothetical protein
MSALLVTALVLSQVQNPYLDEGRRLFNELKYAEAIVQLEVARQVPGLSDAQAVEVMELLARSQVAEGRRADAEKTYGDLLLLDPSFSLDRALSPKILEAFDAAKARVFPKDYFKLEVLASAPGTARLRVIDPWKHAATFELDQRLEGEPAWRLDAVTASGGVVTIKLEAPPLRTLEWFVIARDVNGDKVGGLGDMHEPQRMAAPAVAATETPVTGVAATPRVQRGFGWALAVGTVAAVVVGAVFQALSLSSSHTAQDRTHPQYAGDARAAQQTAWIDADVAAACFIGAGIFAAGGAVVFAW